METQEQNPQLETVKLEQIPEQLYIIMQVNPGHAFDRQTFDDTLGNLCAYVYEHHGDAIDHTYHNGATMGFFEDDTTRFVAVPLRERIPLQEGMEFKLVPALSAYSIAYDGNWEHDDVEACLNTLREQAVSQSIHLEEKPLREVYLTSATLLQYKIASK